jgi:hypothetical protein
MTDTLLYIAAAVLLPLIPAYILYKMLPAKANVRGPFKGLNIQLTGAFGGYFLLVLVVFAFVYSRPPRPVVVNCPPADPYKYEVYKVEGRINVEQQKDIGSITLSLQPPERSVLPNGAFEFDIPVKPGQTGEATFPSLVIGHPEYETETLDLRENPPATFGQQYQIAYDKAARKIVVKDPVILKKKDTAPPYSPTQKAQPIPEPAQ